MKEVVQTKLAPLPGGPYSQAIISEGFMFISGQDGVFPNGNSVGDSIAAQTKACLENIERILAEKGGTVENLVYMTCHLSRLTKKNVADFNDAYAAFFEQIPQKPARITVGSQLLDGDVEISAIAKLS